MSAPKLTGNRCQCTACGEFFSSPRSFDRHRIGDYAKRRECIPAAQLLTNGWTRTSRGFMQEPRAKRAPAGIPARFAPSARVTPHPMTCAPYPYAPARSP